MSAVLDDAVVAAALLASALYVLLTLGPRTLRQRVLSRMARWAARAPARFRPRRVAERLAAAAAKSAACGGCDNCESNPKPGSEGGQSAGASGGEFKIPVDHIGRRR